jgi:hypothetical protein
VARAVATVVQLKELSMNAVKAQATHESTRLLFNEQAFDTGYDIDYHGSVTVKRKPTRAESFFNYMPYYMMPDHRYVYIKSSDVRLFRRLQDFASTAPMNFFSLRVMRAFYQPAVMHMRPVALKLESLYERCFIYRNQAQSNIDGSGFQFDAVFILSQL